MNTTDLVQFRCAEAPTLPAARRPALVPSHYELAAPVRNSIFRARQYLVGRQRLDGSWAGERAGDVVSLSQLVLLDTYLGRDGSELVEQAARAIRRDQLAEGGWAVAPGGPVDLNTSVLAYFSLKLVGEDPSQPAMRRAREAIRAGGGADAVDTATRFWLALLGQIDYDCCPSFAPEHLLMPAGPNDLTAADELRSAAFSVVSVLRPIRKLEFARGIRELFMLPSKAWPTPNENETPKRSAALEKICSWCDRIGWLPFRRRALDRAKSLLVAAAVGPDCDEASVDELAWRWIALAALGFAETSPALAACESRLERLVVVDADRDEARSQPETSLTADTALVIEALYASGLGVANQAVAAGIGWLIEHRVPKARENRNTRESASMLRMLVRLDADNEPVAPSLPPDITMLGRRRMGHMPVPSAAHQPFVKELRKRVVAAQQSDGGWSAWSVMSANPRRCGALRSVDRGPTVESSPEATGEMLDTLLLPGQSGAIAAIHRAADYLRFSQRGDGSWNGTADARHVCGTAWAVRGLISSGATSDDPAVAAGVNWLLVQQQESGGWGEADASAIQTAWAVLALVAAGQADHDATRRAIGFLTGAQQVDGTWSDQHPTERDSATGGWYGNDLHATAQPSMALANWAVSITAQSSDRPARLRLICDESPQ